MVDSKNITRIVNIPGGAIVKFYDEEKCMKVVKAVAECEPIYDCVYCIFCLVKQWDEPQHEDDCPYILAQMITRHKDWKPGIGLSA